jgi:uroporphyrin-III C-methyltransferase
MGKAYLVGAGPGNIEYLTVRAQQLLAQAEVLIYDALVDEQLLTLVPPNCIQFDVGKRGGRPSPSQTEINQLMVEQCRQGKQVVRLKSGDPFIFGRATSEILALQEANCQFEVVPGISSALAAPLLAGIPLTDTVLSRCFAVVSAHEPDELDWEALARLETLVILMGGRHLAKIVQQLQRHGRSSSTPIAVIRACGRPEQEVWVGTLNDIVAQTTGVSLSPAVFAIGEVVGLRDYLRSPDSGQYQQQSPSASQAQLPHPEISSEELKVEPSEEVLAQWGDVEVKTMTTETANSELVVDEDFNSDPNLPPLEVRDSTLPMNDSNPQVIDNWSLDTVERLPVKPSEELNVDPVYSEDSQANLEPDNLQLVTPSNLQPANVYPAIDVQPLPLTGKTVLVTRSAGQSSQFSELLKQEGADVIEMPALVITPPSSWEELDNAIANLYEFDWLILTSSNGVEYFLERLYAQEENTRALGILQIAVVGKKTAASLKAHGITPNFIPPNFVADSLIEHFPEPLEGRRILFPRVESGGRDILVKELTVRGAEVIEVAAYESGCPSQMEPAALDALQHQRVDVITFGSAKTVKHFVQLVEAFLSGDSQQFPTVLSRLQDVCIASIGPQTSIACRQLLGRVDVEAREYTLDGLTQAIVQWATDRRGGDRDNSIQTGDDV